MQDRHATERIHRDRRDLHNLRNLLPLLWEFRGRALVALICLVLAKLSNVGVPLLLKAIVDGLGPAAQGPLVLPTALLLGYGALKLGNAFFSELRDGVFARVRHRAMRRLSTRVLAHLHRLSLRYHLERKTGGVSRDIDRGTRSVSSLLNYMVFSILPTLIEVVMIAGILLAKYDPWVLAASLRHPLHVVEAAKLGAHIGTMPYGVFAALLKHPLTDIGLKRFLEDWQKAKKELGAKGRS